MAHKDTSIIHYNDVDVNNLPDCQFKFLGRKPWGDTIGTCRIRIKFSRYPNPALVSHKIEYAIISTGKGQRQATPIGEKHFVFV